jgi:hypothetical protein
VYKLFDGKIEYMVGVWWMIFANELSKERRKVLKRIEEEKTND